MLLKLPFSFCSCLGILIDTMLNHKFITNFLFTVVKCNLTYLVISLTLTCYLKTLNCNFFYVKHIRILAICNLKKPILK